MNKLLVIDVETTGLDPQRHSILSLGLVVVESQFVTQSKEILIKSYGEIDPKAMEVNKIDMEQHHKNALAPYDAVLELLRFLEENFDIWEEKKIVLAGHNVSFDISFLKQLMQRANVDFSKFFSHRSIDIHSIAYFLYMAGELEQDEVTSDGLIKKYKIEVDGRHTALGDAMASASVLCNMVDDIDSRLHGFYSDDYPSQ